jgi:hypothetical protein
MEFMRALKVLHGADKTETICGQLAGACCAFHSADTFRDAVLK